MSRVAATPPAEHDLLCEGCGYTLNGLPDYSNCPECGKPIAESSPDLRSSPMWERSGDGFLATTFEVLVRPTRFYRTLATRGGNALRAARFSSWHLLLASILLSMTAVAHLEWMLGLSAGPSLYDGYWRTVAFQALVLAIVPFVLLKMLTRLAAKLTAWEATYRGLRLNYEMALRGLQYHAAHYLPVALVAAVTVFGCQRLLRSGSLPPEAALWYLYALCAEVVVSAFYLFWTYWIGMRNMMYANR